MTPQCAKALAAMNDKLSLVLGTHRVEGQNQLLQAVL